MTSPARDDYDSPWKEALERYFPQFLALLFPEVHAGIDWSQGYGFLDLGDGDAVFGVRRDKVESSRRRAPLPQAPSG